MRGSTTLTLAGALRSACTRLGDTKALFFEQLPSASQRIVVASRPEETSLSSWTPSSKGTSLPCATLDQDFRVLDHDRLFVPATTKERSQLSLWNSIDDGAVLTARTPQGGGIRRDGIVGNMTRRQNKRDAPISYRPPEGLRDEFRIRARNSGLSINAFITAAVFGQDAPRSRRSSSIDQKNAVQLLAQSARIRDRLEEGVRRPGNANCEFLLQECRDELAEIRTALMAALGRDP